MKKVKFYLQLIELCLLNMQDKRLQSYLLRYVTDQETDLRWLEQENLIGYTNEGIPFLTPKGYSVLNTEETQEIVFHQLPDRKLVEMVSDANNELCRRYENNDKFCEKVHYTFKEKITNTFTNVFEKLFSEVNHFENEKV